MEHDPSKFINFTLFPKHEIVVMEKGNGEACARRLDTREQYKIIADIEVSDGLLLAAKNWIATEAVHATAQAVLGNEMYRTYRQNGKPREILATT